MERSWRSLRSTEFHEDKRLRKIELSSFSGLAEIVRKKGPEREVIAIKGIWIYIRDYGNIYSLTKTDN